MKKGDVDVFQLTAIVPVTHSSHPFEAVQPFFYIVTGIAVERVGRERRVDDARYNSGWAIDMFSLGCGRGTHFPPGTCQGTVLGW